MPRKGASIEDGSKRKFSGFTEEEREAMKERIRELKGETDSEESVIAKIESMPEPDKSMAKRIHTIVKNAAPSLTSRLWYGMPAYSNREKVVCYFQPAHKFKTRYATFGFMDSARLDEGNMWPVAFALKALTDEEEAKIKALVKRAIE
jgi:uncharacterized protein YdhG (YjbR/CyaY superfamily)